VTGGPVRTDTTDVSGIGPVERVTTSVRARGDGTVDQPAAVPARLSVVVHLTKQEVFGACQALADADPVLVAAGRVDQARALGDLFELLEDRLTAP
jgi:hypothetical protein